MSPPGFEPWHPLISTVNDLKAEGPLSESLRGVQLEVGQSAVVKPPFEQEYEAQQSSHHSLFLSPNSRVTVMSYQDRQKFVTVTVTVTVIIVVVVVVIVILRVSKNKLFTVL